MSEKVVTTPGDVALDAEMHGTNATTGEGCDDLEREILGINQVSGSVVATVIVLNERSICALGFRNPIYDIGRGYHDGYG